MDLAWLASVALAAQPLQVAEQPGPASPAAAEVEVPPESPEPLPTDTVASEAGPDPGSAGHARGAGAGRGGGDGSGRGRGGGGRQGKRAAQRHYGQRTVDGTGQATREQPPRSLEFSPGKGLLFTSDDDKHQLQLGLFTQVLYSVAHERTEDTTTQSLSIRRARLRLGGHAFGVHNKFFIQLAFSPRDLQIREGHPTRSPIFDWYLEFDHVRDATVRVGQFRVPFSRQRRIPVGKLTMADRAQSNFEFNLDRDVGVSLRSPDVAAMGWLRYHAGVFVGEGRDAFSADGFGMLYVARVEALPLGMFSDYGETDRKRRPKPRLSIGAAYAYLAEGKGNRGILGPTPTDGGTSDTHNFTADVVFKTHGVTALGEFYWRDGVRDPGDATVDDPLLGPTPAPVETMRRGLGWFAQLGWLVPRIDLELAGRYGFVRSLGQSSLPSRDELAGSIGYYIHGRALKIVADYTYGWPKGVSASGMHQARLQLQAAF